MFDLKAKKALDTRIGLPVLVGLNLVTRFIGFLLRRNHDRLPVRTIVVAKFQGMGSLLLAKPALRGLRAEYPQARIVFWGTSGMAALARAMPEFDEAIVFGDASLRDALESLVRNLWRLWSLRPDWFFDLEVYSKLSSVLATFSATRNRAGFAVESVGYRKNIHTHLVTFNRYEYLGRAYHRLFGLVSSNKLGLSEASTDFGIWKCDLAPLPRLGGSPYVVVNLHAGELSLERRWPKVSFELLIRRLLESDPSLKVALIGHGAFEVEESAKIPKHERVVDLSGQLSLPDTLACLANARLVVSNDSAPLHMALSLKIPVVGLFGPTRLESYFPSNAGKSVGLSKHLYCSPCVHHWEPPSCGGNNVCMKTITVDEVLKEVSKILGVSISPTSEPMHEFGDFYPGLVVRP